MESAGFWCSRAAWEKMYWGTYLEGVNVGPDLSLFTRIVNNDFGEESCFLSDRHLEALLEDLASGALPCNQPPASSSPEARQMNCRSELIGRVFTALDRNGNGLLESSEMRRFASQTGFEGDDTEWLEEFSKLCRESGIQGVTSVSQSLFTQLVNDESEETGCYCSDDDLATILSDLRKAGSPLRGGPAMSAPIAQRPFDLSRAQLVSAIFKECDADGDALLGCKELQRFAELTGFGGSDCEWASAFEQLCQECGANPAHGVDERLLAGLLDDRSEESGCYQTDDELRAILSRLRARGVES